MSSLIRPISWNHDLPKKAAEIDWIWPGLLARGNLTLLTGGWKTGKTTLVAMLLDRRCQGGLLLNRFVRPGGTIIVSEEDQAMWQRRQSLLDFGPNVGFLCRPFDGRPTLKRWQALIGELLALQGQKQVDLVIIDPLAMFVPVNENQPTSLLGCLADLQRLTRAGLAVLLLHHPAKGQTRPGQAARGSGALPACADILLELSLPRGDTATRRRRLLGFARHEETPRRLALELNAEGTDYAVFTDSEDDGVFRVFVKVVRLILRAAGRPCTRQEILNAWPEELAAPAPIALWRWLNRAVALRVVEVSGKGTRRDAFRYGLCEEAVGRT